MKNSITLLVLAAAALSASAALAAPPSVQVMIRHQTQGCHSWAVAGGAYKASQSLVAKRGTMLRFTDNDVMPHRLVQLSGPKATLRTPNMNKPGAQASAQLLARGTYVFKTTAGEDWMKGMVTKGPDKVLRLTVTVR